MVCLLIFVATVVAATSTLVTFLLFLHLLFLPVEQRAARPLRPCGNIFNLPNGTVSQVKAIPIHDTSARSGSGFCVCGSGMWAKKHKKKETTAGILIILMRALLAMPAVAVAVNRYFALPIE